jgi:hypothetical protein
VGGFDKNSVGATIIGGNGDSFIQKPMKVFNADCFVVAFGGYVEGNVEEEADGFKEAFESTAIINHNNAAKTNLEKDVLDKEASKIVGGYIGSGRNQDKPSKIAHGIEKVSFAAIVGNVARCPKVHMQYVEGAAKRPRENKFTIARNGTVGSKAMRALENPVGNVFTAVRPKEAETNAMERFVDAHVAGSWGGMVRGKDVTAERRRDNDQHKHLGIVLNGLEHN